LIKAEPINFFETENLKSDLKGRSVRGGAVTMTSQAIKFLLQTGSTVVLARLLTPNDYGLIAMVTAITGFVAIFKDMGLSLVTIQKADINQSQISALFWINVAVSFVLALFLAALAPMIAWFYGEPRLTWITISLAGTFLFSGLTVQHQALLARQMLFTVIAVIEIVSIGISIITAIVLAWYGAGYWALVGLSVASALSSMILVWVFCGWRPGLPVREAGILSMVKFGGQITGFDIVNYFARNLDNILLGRFWGANVLGLYSRAYNMMMLPISQIRGPLNSVALPALSHIQDDPIRFKTYYIKLITLIAFITMPLMTFLFICADQVIYLLLGSQWLGASGIFKILCINAFVQPTMSTAGLVLISLGQSKRYLIIGTINSIIIVISFILGLPWGAIGVATAYTIATYVILVPTLWYCYRQSPISSTDFFSAISRPVTAGIIMGFVIFGVHSYMTNVSDIVSIGCTFITGFLTYLMALILIPGGLLLLKEFSSYRTFLFQKS
jgi:PST family polysaccharide transporter